MDLIEFKERVEELAAKIRTGGNKASPLDIAKLSLFQALIGLLEGQQKILDSQRPEKPSSNDQIQLDDAWNNVADMKSTAHGRKQQDFSGVSSQICQAMNHLYDVCDDASLEVLYQCCDRLFSLCPDEKDLINMSFNAVNEVLSSLALDAPDQKQTQAVLVTPPPPRAQPVHAQVIDLDDFEVCSRLCGVYFDIQQPISLNTAEQLLQTLFNQSKLGNFGEFILAALEESLNTPALVHCRLLLDGLKKALYTESLIAPGRSRPLMLSKNTHNLWLALFDKLNADTVSFDYNSSRQLRAFFNSPKQAFLAKWPGSLAYLFGQDNIPSKYKTDALQRIINQTVDVSFYNAGDNLLNQDIQQQIDERRVDHHQPITMQQLEQCLQNQTSDLFDYAFSLYLCAVKLSAEITASSQGKQTPEKRAAQSRNRSSSSPSPKLFGSVARRASRARAASGRFVKNALHQTRVHTSKTLNDKELLETALAKLREALEPRCGGGGATATDNDHFLACVWNAQLSVHATIAQLTKKQVYDAGFHLMPPPYPHGRLTLLSRQDSDHSCAMSQGSGGSGKSMSSLRTVSLGTVTSSTSQDAAEQGAHGGCAKADQFDSGEDEFWAKDRIDKVIALLQKDCPVARHAKIKEYVLKVTAQMNRNIPFERFMTTFCDCADLRKHTRVGPDNIGTKGYRARLQGLSMHGELDFSSLSNLAQELVGYLVNHIPNKLSQKTQNKPRLGGLGSTGPTETKRKVLTALKLLIIVIVNDNSSMELGNCSEALAKIDGLIDSQTQQLKKPPMVLEKYLSGKGVLGFFQEYFTAGLDINTTLKVEHDSGPNFDVQTIKESKGLSSMLEKSWCDLPPGIQKELSKELPGKFEQAAEVYAPR